MLTHDRGSKVAVVTVPLSQCGINEVKLESIRPNHLEAIKITKGRKMAETKHQERTLVWYWIFPDRESAERGMSRENGLG